MALSASAGMLLARETARLMSVLLCPVFSVVAPIRRGSFPEEDARRWQEQLDQADKEGRFAFVSVPVLTTATAI